ncbi:MAG TPA: hypothetical protein VD735_02640 [Candidatus Saccharimonadales bacterium]|nr:hypothetical protein [Candidatus Saccharimonadales bacterium]
MAATQGEGSQVMDGDRVVLDSEADGAEAPAGYGRQLAGELAPQIDDERGLVINVLRNKTLWDIVRRRTPQVGQTFQFRNDPPQYV